MTNRVSWRPTLYYSNLCRVYPPTRYADHKDLHAGAAGAALLAKRAAMLDVADLGGMVAPILPRPLPHADQRVVAMGERGAAFKVGRAPSASGRASGVAVVAAASVSTTTCARCVRASASTTVSNTLARCAVEAAAVCAHNRVRSPCKDCGGPSICRARSRCKDRRAGAKNSTAQLGRRSLKEAIVHSFIVGESVGFLA